MSASADNSMWSPVNESYALSTYPYGIPRTSDEINIEYPPPTEPDYDPLIPIPPTEAEREEKMRGILANLKTIVHRIEEEAAFTTHLETFVNSASRSNLAGEPQPTTTDVSKIMREFDGISLDEKGKGKKAA